MRSAKAKRLSHKSPVLPHRAQGYALIIMLVFVVIGGIFGLSRYLSSTAAQNQQRNDTATVLRLAKDALIAYAATYPDSHTDQVFGYLPCPDTTGNGEADSDCSTSGPNDETRIGLLPFKTLGLPVPLDSQGNCLWYAVSGRFKNNPKTSSNNPIPGSLNWDTQAQISVQDSNGITLVAPEQANAIPSDPSGGAAAIIFAVGPPLTGQNRTSNGGTTCAYSPGTNNANNFVESGTYPSTANITVRMGDINSTTNNDALIWVTPKEIFERVKHRNKIATDPGGSDDLVARINSLSTSISSWLIGRNNGYLGASLPAPLNPGTPAISGLTYGNLPASVSVGATQLEYLNNWGGQFRYVVCNNGTKCLNSATSTPCTGLLIFSGERSGGGPRTTAEKSLTTSFLDTATLNSLANGTLAVSSFSITNPASASGDFATACLNPAFPPETNGVSAFQAVSTPVAMAQTNAAGTVLTLGTTSSLGSNTYGCTWNPNIMNISQGLRVYFRFKIANQGEGFTFALADSSTNPSISMCGSYGSLLGYAGTNGSTAAILPPKLGLEFDTSSSALLNDPSDHHVAFVFWGSDATRENDNKHGVCASSGAPCNPSSNPGLSNLSALDDTDTYIYVRLDIVPAPNTTNLYALKAYVTSSIAVRDNINCSYTDMDRDMGVACTPKISAFLSTSMVNAYMGFTLGQSTGSNASQTIVIDDFMSRTP